MEEVEVEVVELALVERARVSQGAEDRSQLFSRNSQIGDGFIEFASSDPASSKVFDQQGVESNNETGGRIAALGESAEWVTGEYNTTGTGESQAVVSPKGEEESPNSNGQHAR